MYRVFGHAVPSSVEGRSVGSWDTPEEAAEQGRRTNAAYFVVLDRGSKYEVVLPRRVEWSESSEGAPMYCSSGVSSLSRPQGTSEITTKKAWNHGLVLVNDGNRVWFSRSPGSPGVSSLWTVSPRGNGYVLSSMGRSLTMDGNGAYMGEGTTWTSNGVEVGAGSFPNFSASPSSSPMFSVSATNQGEIDRNATAAVLAAMVGLVAVVLIVCAVLWFSTSRK